MHSGCGISGTIWLILFVAIGTREYVRVLSPVGSLHPQLSDHPYRLTQISLPTIVISWIILALLLVMIVFAFPDMRTKFHDSFEWTHRFLGWIALALVWAQIILFINDNRKLGEPLSHACKHNAVFWLQCIITASIVISWLRLRKVDVRAIPLSRHATRLYFNYSM